MLGLWLGLAACASQEGQVINKFFMATKSKDNATLTGMTRLGFPEEVGEVTAWKVTQVGAERREPFKLQELAQKVQEAKQARDQKIKDFSDFRDANIDDMVTIEDRLKKDANATFKGSLADVHATWQKHRDERRELESQLGEAEQRFEEELTLAGMSLMGASDSESLQSFSGDVLIKEVGVSVSLKDGKEKPYVFTLLRYALTTPKTNRIAQARWIITDIKPKEAAAASSGGTS
jgi:hypothetical protein